MNKKKCKLEYDIEEVKAQLRKLIIEENIITNQKCYIYTQLKTYKDLYFGLQNKYKELEIENAELYEQTKFKSDSKIVNKENSNTEIDESINMTEDIKNKLNEYTNRMTDQYDDENTSTKDKLIKLRTDLKEKDEKIVELENTVIKLQILSRSNSIKSDPEEINEDELINLKTRVEYSEITKERLIINSNNKIMETKIKYEEFMKSYDKLSENFNNSLLKIEDLKNIVKEKEKKKIEQVLILEEKIKNFKIDINIITDKLNILSRYYHDFKSLFVLTNKQNLNLLMKLKNYKIFEDKKNHKTGEDFFDEEISNLLEVCDSLTEDNKKLNLEIKDLELKINNLKIEKSKIENERDQLILNSKSNNVLKYVEDLNQQKKVISEYLQEIKVLTEEKNRLIRLNVDRIRISDKYKDELRIKNIENVCLERKNEDIEKMIKDLKSEIYDRICANKKVPENKACVICNLCDSNPKNVAITSCMHTFCENCINLRIKLRDRKCPTCGNSFHVSDVKRLFL